MPDCDTTACSFSAATQVGSTIRFSTSPTRFLGGYQVERRQQTATPTVPINDNIDYDGAVVSWIENLAGDRPFGNDLDPTLNLDLLEVSFRNHERWQILEAPTPGDGAPIIRFQNRLARAGRSPIRARISTICRNSTAPISAAVTPHSSDAAARSRAAIDPGGRFGTCVAVSSPMSAGRLVAAEMNPFDAALALLALAKLDAEPGTFAPALDALRAVSARAPGARPSRPTNGTR